MRVHPSQLVPGCILTKEVMGRTKRPSDSQKYSHSSHSYSCIT